MLTRSITRIRCINNEVNGRSSQGGYENLLDSFLYQVKSKRLNDHKRMVMFANKLARIPDFGYGNSVEYNGHKARLGALHEEVDFQRT